MHRWLCAAAAAVLACQPAPLDAQQGTVQVSAAAQGTTGAPERLAGQHAVDPDFGVSWLQPRSALGTFQLEVRGTRRGDRAHLGRTYASARDVKYGGLLWTFEAGDAHFTRRIREYRFANLTAPAVTFSGGSVSARSTRGTLNFVGGRSTAWRNIFGTDPETLEQTLAVGDGSYELTRGLHLTGRASRITTGGVKEFSLAIADSRQAGGGVRFTPAPAVQLVADGSIVQFRRRGADTLEFDGSLLAGAHVFLGRGWAQVNASRFSPGDFPAINDSLRDRETIFAAGEYDVWRRVRVFGGWDWFRTNIGTADPAGQPFAPPRNMGSRGFAGVRLQVGARSTVTLRAEDGDAKSRSILQGLAFESDTGVWSAEWHAALGTVTSYVRASRRENVSRTTADGSYTQQDVSTQLFVRLSTFTQLFALTTLTRHETGLAAGSSYWQAGGGAQVQIASTMWARGEMTASRNVDLVTRDFVPRESINVGLTGQLARSTSIAFNVTADRTPLLFGTGTPWTTRSTLRVIQTFSMGSARVEPGTSALAAVRRARGTGTIVGSVFADWNSNGVQEAGEEPLESIPVQILSLSAVSTARNGEFSFASVPAGRQQVALDAGAIPVDFDLPALTSVDVELDRGTTRRVSFGLIPLGSIRGLVFVDANGNGVPDAGEPPLDGAVLVLDGGERSEQVRRGAYRFDAVRSGDHVLTLLLESLPEGSVITSPAEVRLALGRDRRTADVHFAVIVEKRPEMRRVFPPRLGSAPPVETGPATRTTARSASSKPRGSGGAASATAPAASRARSSGSRPRPAGTFTVQIAALHDPVRARSLVHQLAAAGHPAYLMPPPVDDPDGPFRVRVGSYGSRADAAAAASRLHRKGEDKPWIVLER